MHYLYRNQITHSIIISKPQERGNKKIGVTYQKRRYGYIIYNGYFILFYHNNLRLHYICRIEFGL